MPQINDVIKFIDSKTDRKQLNILDSEEDIILLKAYIKKLKLSDYIKIKELNRILSVQDLLVLWLRFRIKFTIKQIAEILSIEENKARSLIGNALINITQIDLTTQDDKCFFTSAKIPFYLTSNGKVCPELSISKQLITHIKHCQFCKKNFNAFNESIKKIEALPILETGDTEYVLYNKEKHSTTHVLLLVVLVLFVFTGIFISPKFDVYKSIQKSATKLSKTTKQHLETIKQTYKDALSFNKTTEKTKQNTEKAPINVQNNKQAATENKPIIKDKKTYKTKAVVKFLAYKKIKNIKHLLSKVLAKYKVKHFGELDWGTELNNGYYYHLLVNKDNLKAFETELNKLGNFKKLATNSKEQILPINYSRVVLWISKK